jgi:hypothetical protein
MRKSYLIYLSYVNDFITASKCASYHRISMHTMYRIIKMYQILTYFKCLDRHIVKEPDYSDLTAPSDIISFK